MQDRNKTAAPAAAAGQAVKEKIFSIIKKASQEGITDGRRVLWIDFTPNIAVEEKEDGFVVWLWREGVVVKVFLDFDLNVVGFDVEGP
jgi:predicted RecA/RadA family phage recombinase